jgi:hypothetical protein
VSAPIGRPAQLTGMPHSTDKTHPPDRPGRTLLEALFWRAVLLSEWHVRRVDDKTCGSCPGHRCWNPLTNLLQPDIGLAYARSLVRMLQGGGDLPRWPLANGYTGGWLRVRAEIMGSQKCGIGGKSQSVLIRIHPIIFTRSRRAVPRSIRVIICVVTAVVQECPAQLTKRSTDKTHHLTGCMVANHAGQIILDTYRKLGGDGWNVSAAWEAMNRTASVAVAHSGRVSRSCARIGSLCLRHCVHGASIGLPGRLGVAGLLRQREQPLVPTWSRFLAPISCWWLVIIESSLNHHRITIE